MDFRLPMWNDQIKYMTTIYQQHIFDLPNYDAIYDHSRTNHNGSIK